ncbi:hypothetical protein ACH4HG_10445 [Streptomyces coeruleorubidus]|uniref:hypothetical protein n=1 Tax=Streptomyces coeruleorubidus TaxID=116188 RepID=UPI001999E221|nr:hypothetical protein GCM10010244_04560 [Streptomyces bellus]
MLRPLTRLLARLPGACAMVVREILTHDAWIRATHPEPQRTTRLGLLLVLGIALLFTGISVADTMVMATSDRARDLSVLRLAGATRWQVCG